jgi:hypothetical protein
MFRASASVRFAAMAGPPMNALNVANIAIRHIVRLGLPKKPSLSVKSDFVSVLLVAPCAL